MGEIEGDNTEQHDGMAPDELAYWLAMEQEMEYGQGLDYGQEMEYGEGAEEILGEPKDAKGKYYDTRSDKNRISPMPAANPLGSDVRRQAVGPLDPHHGKSSENKMAMPGVGHGGSMPSRSIPFDKNVIVQHYVAVTPRKPKRGRQASPERFHGKVHRRSTSHSTAGFTRNPSPSAILRTKWSTREPSPSGVPSMGWSSGAAGSTRGRSPLLNPEDLQGASRTTGGIFRGRASGSGYNMADAGKFIPISSPSQ